MFWQGLGLQLRTWVCYLTLFQATFLTFVKQHFSILELSLNYINVKRQIHALMTSRLDYCNYWVDVMQVQLIQNAEARMLTRISRIKQNILKLM